MARFCVHRLKYDGALALDVQAEILGDLDTRTMIPLLSQDAIAKTFPRLNPTFEIEGTRLVMATQFMAVVPTREIGATIVDLRKRADEITAALDFLFQGF
ncbi:CcdB family protein [Rhizobium sp. DKSPLA3]|uniref:Toxin CcdB n=1 Tax=Rhizobium quercicola TaxID=2901226 RepID=A0A9X1NTJ1_9HYPH|nr:CcdB family protein [Rhizobium quercicola]MCD7110075.1 CcdB family protein [Rhizobium quercicola]